MAKQAGKYMASGQPTLDDLAAHKSNGVVAVVNVRLPTEQASLGFSEEEEVISRGMKYLNIPISGPAELSEEKAKELDEFLNSVGDGCVLIHWQGGNRAAGLLTLRSMLAGETLSVDEALSFGRELGMKAPVEGPVSELLNHMISQKDA